MEIHVLDQFEHTFTADDIMDQLGMPRDHKFRGIVEDVMAGAAKLANPVAFYLECKVEECTEDSLTVGGQTFTARSWRS